MIIYLLLKGLIALESAFFSLVPSIDTPLWLAKNLPEILSRVSSFNYYLPVVESVEVVIFVIGFVLVWKIAKIILKLVFIDLDM